ncbi:MAG TPA: bifunctional rhamnulose-1-phosphate aldolase/short-chain dehydrogenase [Kofleriaceae bacterium]|jgi:rhamnulose-1-phosphate aldolase/alcohol dehydrogenase|nr:bifunctional rhamnulose-1-phosphate aldolase/short-chain dehydrogenase [Kofleriaceae bacterium]
MKHAFEHVKYLWQDEVADQLGPVDRLVYRSNKLGEDLTLTNTGGGNTSSKLEERDPLTAEPVEVLWIKGSGGDLRTTKKDGLASLYLDKVRAMKSLYLKSPGRGPKTQVEDDMYPMYSHCVFNLNPRACSIDTPLHTLVPYKHVDHLHPNSVIALAASVNQQRLTAEVYGEDALYVPWQRPGFDISLLIEDAIKAHPRARGCVLGHHGMSAWANEDRDCYETSLGLVDRAARFIAARDRGDGTFGGPRHRALPEPERHRVLVELLPWLRGQVSASRRVIATIQDDASMLRFVGSVDGPRLAALGTSCPDHFLRTKIRPLFVDWDPDGADVGALRDRLAAGLEQYRLDYAAYYQRCKRRDSPAIRDPNPTVILIPGLGMIAWGKTKSESRVTAEFYNCAIEVMRGAEAIDRYEAMDEQEAFDIEYWPLEDAKLRRMPPEKELDRQVIVVVGAGNGIGKALALRTVQDGAHVVCVDRDAAAAKATAQDIIAKYGDGIGVAGTGLSRCGPAIALACDITRRDSVQNMLSDVMIAYGGLDAVAVTAGVFAPPDRTGHNTDEQWRHTFDVNVIGSYIVADEAGKILRRQGLPAALVLTTSANAVVAKKGSLAYDASKAAANHLVRELAIELAPLVRVNAVAPATVVTGSTLFPRDRVIASLTKYEIGFGDDESTEALRHKLAVFYASRTLTRTPIEPEDQAEALYLLLTRRLSKTTGHVLPVDGGLQDGFLR